MNLFVFGPAAKVVAVEVPEGIELQVTAGRTRLVVRMVPELAAAAGDELTSKTREVVERAPVMVHAPRLAVRGR